MKTIATFFSLLFFIGIHSVCSAQKDTATFNYPNVLNYKSGIIYNLKGDGFNVKPLTFDVTTNHVNGNPASSLSFHLLDVDKIKVQKGNEAWFWGLVGATLTTYLTHELVKEGADPGIYAFGLIGAGVGIAIGSRKKTYKTIYDNGYFIH